MPTTEPGPLLREIGVTQRSRAGSFEAVLEWAEGRPRGRVLDAPCGPGLLSEALRRVGFDCVAADLDREGFELRDRIPFVTLDLDAPLPFADAVFDLIYCGDGIEHLENPFALLRELARVLSAKGSLIVVTPHYTSMERRLGFLLTGSLERPLVRGPLPADRSSRMQRGHINPMTLPRLAFAAEGAGLALMESRTLMPRRGQRWLAPLAALVWLVQRLQPESVRRGLFGDHSLSWRVLMGGKAVMAVFRRPLPGSSSVPMQPIR
jgi:SAM-dependent methyltransferase